VTCDSFAGAWPDREAAGGEDASYSAQLGDTRKIVVSRQPLEFTWRNSELLDGELIEAVAARKGRRLFDEGDASYHLKVLTTEVFPTGVIRVIYALTAAPGG
jgi:hypothetical protein